MNHWTEEQKTFAEGKQFALLACFGDNEDVDEHIFENHPILPYMIRLQAEFIQYGSGYASYEVVVVKIDKPILVLHYDYVKVLVSYFDNEDDANIFVHNKEKELKEKAECSDDECDKNCILDDGKFCTVDLRTKIPYFITNKYEK